MYSAYCMNNPSGGVRLAVFFDGFEDQEEAQFFLRMMMAPFDEPSLETDTIH